jgi:hypothetical protein
MRGLHGERHTGLPSAVSAWSWDDCGTKLDRLIVQDLSFTGTPYTPGTEAWMDITVRP